MFDETVPVKFNHPKNITIGSGRIIWARGSTCTSGIHHPEGWVLPGGERTLNMLKARAAATAIDAICGETS